MSREIKNISKYPISGISVKSYYYYRTIVLNKEFMLKNKTFLMFIKNMKQKLIKDNHFLCTSVVKLKFQKSNDQNN